MLCPRSIKFVEAILHDLRIEYSHNWNTGSITYLRGTLLKMRQLSRKDGSDTIFGSPNSHITTTDDLYVF